MQSPNSPDGKISQRLLIEARNAERVGGPIWLQVFKPCHSGSQIDVEDGELTVNAPWNPEIPFVTTKDEQLPAHELRHMSAQFYRKQLAIIESEERKAAKQRIEENQEELRAWKERRRLATENRDWAKFMPLVRDRLGILEQSALHRTATVLCRLGFYSAAHRIQQALNAHV